MPLLYISVGILIGVVLTIGMVWMIALWTDPMGD